MDRKLRVGVVGVGSMGTNHVRVYDQMNDVDLVGVADADDERAAQVASEYDTDSCSLNGLLNRVDAASVAVPTPDHYQTVRQCLETETHTLVEKPFVETAEQGRELIDVATSRDLTLQVGHIERFNPAARVLRDVIDEMDVVALDARRLGPPRDREILTGVINDLMIHDLDLALWLTDETIERAAATGTPDGQFATAQLTFGDGTIGVFTASRTSQRRVRTLQVDGRERRAEVDHTDQSIHIHRQSQGEYRLADGDLTHHEQRVTEQPLVTPAEPLSRELASFREAIVKGNEPAVTAHEGLRAFEVAKRLTDLAAERPTDDEWPSAEVSVE